jgi:hypothetical protein
MKNITSFVKTVALACAVGLSGLIASTQDTEAQTQFQAQELVASNMWIFGGAAGGGTSNYSTNLVSANYAFTQNPNIVVDQAGFFTVPPVLPATPSAGPTFGSCAGVTFQLTFEQASNNGAYFPTNLPSAVQTTATMSALIQPVLDDASLQNVGNLYSITNSSMFSVAFSVGASIATNGLITCQSWVSGTNFVGCKYGKLIGFYGIGTNAFWLQHLRVGNWPPMKTQ